MADPSFWFKDPGDYTDYEINWADWIRPGDTIASVNIDPDVLEAGGVAPLEAATATIDGTVVIVWLTGGDDGLTYLLSCTVTMTSGRVGTRQIYVKISKQFATIP